jgi:hypothetical protein
MCSDVDNEAKVNSPVAVAEAPPSQGESPFQLGILN